MGIPVGYLLATQAGMGPAGLWWGLAAGLGAVAVVQNLRVRARLSRAMQRLVIDEDLPGESAA